MSDLDPRKITISDYTYSLPDDKIALRPTAERDRSKLLTYHSGEIKDRLFREIADIIPPNSLLVLNDTKVIEARILFQKATGGVIEIFCLEPHSCSMEEALQTTEPVQWNCLVGGASKWKNGQTLEKEIEINGKQWALNARYVSKLPDAFVIEFSWTAPACSFADVMHEAGNIPLPPYIKRLPEDADRKRYQTSFAKHEGSVAAPTAALHFTHEVFASLSSKRIRSEFITLNVGAGTFKPVKAETIADHDMHREAFSIRLTTLESILESTHITAVGTTTLRTLETIYWLGVKLVTKKLNDWHLAQWEAYELDQTISVSESLRAITNKMREEGLDQLNCTTSLLIAPGYRIKIPSALITNFHQPQSTLLLLVAAFIGDDWKKVYQHALQNDYRFLSYGDSSYLTRKADSSTPL